MYEFQNQRTASTTQNSALTRMGRRLRQAGVLTFATFAAVGSSILPAIAQIQPGRLTVRVDGFRDQRGQICYNLFANSSGFPSNARNAVRSGCQPVTGTSVQLTFDNLQPGSYALAVLHDANNNTQPDRNVLGIPVEGFGFSDNPVIRTGPPRFSDADVFVAGSNTQIQVHLRYLL